jgi:glycosyltransferase involved in cell wall biosynthesis
MKIGFFTDAYLPQLGGVSTMVAAWAEGLEKLGHEVYIIAPKYKGYKDKKNVIRLDSFKFVKQPEVRLGIYSPGKVLYEISKINFDIIHGFSGGTISSLGLIVSRLKKVPFVFAYCTRYNQYTHYFLKGKIVKPKMVEKASKIFCNGCDYVIAHMPKIKNELVSFGIKKPIAIIPSGVDINKFKKSRGGYLRNKTGIKKGKILLCVGRLGKEKSIDFLIKAFKLIHTQDKDTNLVLVSAGIEKDNLQKLAGKLGLEKSVYFVGEIDPREINKAYADADIFVFASQTETQGIVILEALASGVPVVAVNDEVYNGVVKNGENGILVKKNLLEFAQACLKILENSAYRQKLSKEAIKSMRKFSLSETIISLDKLYKGLVAKSI